MLSATSSLFAVVYIVKGKKVSSMIDPLHYLLILTFVASFLFMTLGPLFNTEDFHFNFNTYDGMFGWLNKDNIVYCSLVLSLVNGCGTLTL